MATPTRSAREAVTTISETLAVGVAAGMSGLAAAGPTWASEGMAAKGAAMARAPAQALIAAHGAAVIARFKTMSLMKLRPRGRGFARAVEHGRRGGSDQDGW